MKYLFFFIGLVTFNITISQELEAQAYVGEVVSMNDLFSKQLRSKSGNEIKGNPYLYKEWKKNGIVISKGNRHQYHAINYDIYRDQVVVLKSKDSVFIIDKYLIDGFVINNRKFSQYKGSFYEELYSGDKASLLKKYETKIIEGMFNPTDATRKPDRLNIVDDYYIKKGDNIVKFSPSKKTLSETFGISQGELKSYLKKNKLSYKNEKDLTEIFKHYNQ
jgi:hypothetical protein